MVKQLFILFVAVFFVKNNSFAQSNGILPLSGIRYFKEGIWAKSIDVKIDGAWLLGNRLPLNKEIEISLQQPSGFIADINKTVFAAAEFILESAKGELILKNPNVFLLNETKGFAAKDFKTLSIKFGINEELMKYNSNCLIRIRVYDLKGKNQLRLEFPVNIIRYGEAVQLSKSVNLVKSPSGSTCLIAGLTAKNMLVSVDTTIKVSPNMAYTSLDIFKILGTSLGGIFQGKENFWVYDNGLNEIKISDILLKQVGGALEDNDIDYTLKIPYRLKKVAGKSYTVRFRWQSADKSQVIDVVASAQ